MKKKKEMRRWRIYFLILVGIMIAGGIGCIILTGFAIYCAILNTVPQTFRIFSNVLIGLIVLETIWLFGGYTIIGLKKRRKKNKKSKKMKCLLTLKNI